MQSGLSTRLCRLGRDDLQGASPISATRTLGSTARAARPLASRIRGIRMAPGERIELELDLAAGSYGLRGPQLPWSIDFEVQPTGVTRRWEINLGAVAASDDPPRLRSGGQRLTLVNPHPRKLVVRCERTVARRRTHGGPSHGDGALPGAFSRRSSGTRATRRRLDGESVDCGVRPGVCGYSLQRSGRHAQPSTFFTNSSSGWAMPFAAVEARWSRRRAKECSPPSTR